VVDVVEDILVIVHTQDLVPQHIMLPILVVLVREVLGIVILESLHRVMWQTEEQLMGMQAVMVGMLPNIILAAAAVVLVAQVVTILLQAQLAELGVLGKHFQ
tara:strand:+ start:304 stop:609 length:306 start_codon:yes stop_codon:yes gene_type:complete